MTSLKGEKNPNYKGGYAMRKHWSLYKTWYEMHQRCYNKEHPRYKTWGGRGIDICEEWHDPKTFCDWGLAQGWKKGLHIDRIDNDGGYSPNNCRWVTSAENARNRSTTKLNWGIVNEIRARAEEGEKLIAISKDLGVNYNTLIAVVHFRSWKN